MDDFVWDDESFFMLVDSYNDLDQTLIPKTLTEPDLSVGLHMDDLDSLIGFGSAPRRARSVPPNAGSTRYGVR